MSDAQFLGASNMLYHLTGRRWPGSCQDTVRPCAQTYDNTWRPIRSTVGGLAGGCGCGVEDRCGCGGYSAIDLGVQPVTQIDSVKIDGATIDSSLYQIHDYRLLVWADPDGTAAANTTNRTAWPCCQDLTADPDTDTDTFEVTFTYGIAPPEPGPQAAAELAGELYLACQPETAGQCRLPPGLQSLVRQGVTMNVKPDPDQLMGLPTVAAFLKVFSKRSGGSVMIPGRSRKAVRVTG